MSLPFGPPVPVSPLIRGIRFGLLIAGILYGRSKQSFYGMREASWRVEEAKRQIIRDKEAAVRRERIRQEEAESVRLFETGKLFDVPPKK